MSKKYIVFYATKTPEGEIVFPFLDPEDAVFDTEEEAHGFIADTLQESFENDMRFTNYTEEKKVTKEDYTISKDSIAYPNGSIDKYFVVSF